MSEVIPVVLAGGTGSRLWPLSRQLFPKQFHALFSDRSLLQETLDRAACVTPAAPIIVCNEEHRFLVAEQCRAAGRDWRKLILEPVGRHPLSPWRRGRHRRMPPCWCCRRTTSSAIEKLSASPCGKPSKRQSRAAS